MPHAGAVLIVERLAGQGGVPSRELLGRIEQREAVGEGPAIGFVLDTSVDAGPAHLVEGL